MLTRYVLIWKQVDSWAADAVHFRRAVLGIFLFALILRVVAAVVHPYYLPDSADYSALAKAIATGHRYEVHGQFARRMPGYPVFMAGFYALFGFHHFPILLVQAMFSALTTSFCALFGRYVSPATGLLAGALAAVDPLGIGFSASLLTEPLFTFVFMVSLYLFFKIMQRPNRWGLWVSFAALWAVGVYIRAEVSLCLFPLLLWSVLVASRGPDRKNSALGSILTVLLVGVCLLPWWIRNDRLFHQDFFRFTTLQGISLYESVYSGATGGPRQSDLIIPPSIQRLNESQRDLAWTHRAFTDIFQHPSRVFRLAFVKIARTWSPWLHARGYASVWLNIVLTLWYTPLFLLAIIGLFRYPMWSPLFGVLLVPIVYFTLMHAVFLGSVRYRVPVMPLVVVFTAMGMAPAIRRKQDSARVA